MFTASGSRDAPSGVEPAALSPVTAAEIAMEYASLGTSGGCPRGIYLTPSPLSLSHWYGVFFVHSGPYNGAVLRFIMTFKADFPSSAPVIRFESEIFHPLIDTKTKVWHPQRALLNWQSRAHHVSHLLHDLKTSFELAALDSILESEAVNKQIWSLYHRSHQTFLSMTAQRALSTTSSRVLYPDVSSAMTDAAPTSPTTPKGPAPKHHRQSSINSSLRSTASRENMRGQGEGYIAFRKLGEDERESVLEVLRARV